jgi:hypothetical protein
VVETKKSWPFSVWNVVYRTCVTQHYETKNETILLKCKEDPNEFILHALMTNLITNAHKNSSNIFLRSVKVSLDMVRHLQTVNFYWQAWLSCAQRV